MQLIGEGSWGFWGMPQNTDWCMHQSGGRRMRRPYPIRGTGEVGACADLQSNSVNVGAASTRRPVGYAAQWQSQ